MSHDFATAAIVASASCLTIGVPAQAIESITIGRLLANPFPYQLQMVGLQGTAHEIRALPVGREGAPRPRVAECSLLPPFTFVLADDTGFLQIVVEARAWCSAVPMPAIPPEVFDGDRVMLDVQIEVRETYEHGALRREVSAVARTIRRLVN